MTKHQSVLVEPLLTALQPKAGVYLDATFGGGGHSRAILDASAPTGRVVGIDRDESVQLYADKLADDYPQRFRFQVLSYSEVAKLNENFDGAVMDLGLSSDQLESSGRGFSFQKFDEPLDLRFSSYGQTAAEFLRQAPLSRIEQTFRDFAQDKYWRRLAGTIVQTRRQQMIRTVGDFVTVVGTSEPKVLAPLFQALRIEVNQELSTLKQGLKAISTVLKPGGRLAVISFHSLEDRIVKEFFRGNDFDLLTKKPIVPTEVEIARNPRSRSAKMRAGFKR